MAVTALGILLGMLALQNRFAWVISLAMLSFGTGIVMGFCTAMEVELAIEDAVFWNGWLAAALPAAGMVFYLLAGILAVVIMRRMEVR